MRFLGHDIVPAPLRSAALADPETWLRLRSWLRPILADQILPGPAQTLILFPLAARRFVRPLLVVVRATPEYMLAYCGLQLLGPAMLPTIGAPALHNAGIGAYLIGRHGDALPYRADAPAGLNPRRLRDRAAALRAVPGLSAVPLGADPARERDPRGLLEVATLGFHVDAAISELRLDVALVPIAATALMTMAVDGLSRLLRRSLRIDTPPTRLPAPVAEGA